MSGLPRRFPRTSLIQHAAMLDSRIQQLLDDTNRKIDEAEDRGMGTVTHKLAARFNALDDARIAMNDVRRALYELK